MHRFSCQICTTITLILLHFFLLSFSAKTPTAKKEVKYGRASLVLYQGTVRHEIQGANCPVGVSFLKPERFSCACVNGVWAFYNVMCDLPLAIIGGHNYCFQMPDSFIQQVAVISNPLRPLEDTLSIFEGQQESIRTKVYRNLHLPLEGANFFLALNSSWTLKSTDGKEEVCLSSHFITRVDDPSFLNGMYCNFANISHIMPSIGAILKGCNGTSTKIEPVDCQPLLAPNTEAICSSSAVLEAYTFEVEKESNKIDSANSSVTRFKRKYKHTTTMPTTTPGPTRRTTTKKTMPTMTTEEPTEAPRISGRRAGRVITKGHQTMGRAADRPQYDDGDNSNVNVPGGDGKNPVKEETPPVPEPGPEPEPIAPLSGTDNGYGLSGDGILSADDMIKLMNQEWDNKENFLVPPIVQSEAMVMNQIWKYEKMNIQNALGLGESEEESKANSQIVSLIQISRDIMSKICPIVPGEIFTMALEAFLAIQKKNFHWKEPYIAYNDYLRIIAALSTCKDRAQPFDFVSTKDCITKNPEQLILGKDTSNTTTINIKDRIPEDFKSKGYEPIVELVWKIVVSTHSYCFRDFSDLYNDHHKYTVILLPIFLNDINKLWFDHRDKAIDDEYAGVMGPAAAILDDIDKCATATRLISEYPFDLSRPSLDNEIDSNVETVVENTPPKTQPGNIPDSVNISPNEQSEDNTGSKRRKVRTGRHMQQAKEIAKSRKTRSVPNNHQQVYTEEKVETEFSKTEDMKKRSPKIEQLDDVSLRGAEKYAPSNPKIEFVSDNSKLQKRQGSKYSWRSKGFVTTDKKIEMARSRRTAPVSKPSSAKPNKPKDKLKNKQGTQSLDNKIEAWKKSRLILNNLGYCVKKYDEQRKFLDQNCDL